MALQQEDGDCAPACCCLITILVVAVIVIGPIVWLAFSSNKDPEYSVTITSVASLDQVANVSAAGRTLSPVFNLMLRIDGACIPGGSIVAVSYGDALLGKGTVPEFCSRKKQAQESDFTAWGEDVAVLQFLRTGWPASWSGGRRQWTFK